MIIGSICHSSVFFSVNLANIKKISCKIVSFFSLDIIYYFYGLYLFHFKVFFSKTVTPMKNLNFQKLLENNHLWIQEKLNEDSDYFEKLSKGQSPRYLMIGCSDSRVPITSLIKAEAGEVFIHRNIANQVNLNDINLLSVLEYSVEHLHIKHIVVIGHYNCGGIAAAVDGVNQGLIENWVSPVNELYYKHKEELSLIEDNHTMCDRLSEINVIEQAINIIKTPILKRAFKSGEFPKIHAWIFDIYTGKIVQQDLKENSLIENGLLPKNYFEIVNSEN
ncbi:MAG: carbonic anhydrase [Bacteroidetes bacterium]|nr:MAG: carbonic anhydrase [Bacteroidota bacterium]